MIFCIVFVMNYGLSVSLALSLRFEPQVITFNETVESEEFCVLASSFESDEVILKFQFEEGNLVV